MILQSVAQPLHDGAADEHAAFERVVGATGALPGHGGNQLVLRLDDFASGVEQQEATRSVGVLGHSGRQARLSEKRRLLVACDARDGHGRIADAAFRAYARRCDHRRQHRARNVEQREELIVPLAGVDVEQQRAARVRCIGDVGRAARQIPDQPRVDRAERELSALCARSRAIDVVEQPLELGAGKIGVENQPRLLREQALRAPLRAARRRCRRCAGPARRSPRATGLPVARSHSTVVSRWLVMPIAATSAPEMAAFASASLITPDCVAQISFASCSTQPGCGKCCANSRCASALMPPEAIEHDRAGAGGALVQGEHE